MFNSLLVNLRHKTIWCIIDMGFIGNIFPWPRSCNHIWWQGTLWLGAEFHCLPLQGKRGHIGKGQLPRSQADRAGYENPGEDCGRPHQTVGVNWRFPGWLRPRQRHYRRNLCCQAAAKEVSSCQQETLHGFRRPGEGVWSSTSEGHLVGAEKTWCGGVDCATGAGDVCKCRRRVREGYSEEFEMKVGVHQGSVLSPLLFIIVLEALSREFRSGVPWEDLYADDLVIIAESLEECVRRLLTWKEAMEKKGLRVNAGKTKIMICGTGLDLLQSSGEFPCAVCHTGVGSNSIFCNGYKHWVHKKCSELKRLKKDPDYRCTRCQGTTRPLDGRPQKEVQVGPDEPKVVASFCYLGDMLSAAGGCELSTTTCVKTVWKKFKDLLPVLSSRHLSFKTRGHVYSSCVRSAMLHASKTWPLTKPNLQRLQRNDRAMIRQICNVRPQDIVTTRSNELLVRLGIEDLDLILKERKLWWYGHVERSNGAIKTAFDIQVDGRCGPGKPKMTWKQLTERDCREWKLSAINPHEGVVGWCEGAVYLTSLGRPADIGLQLGKTCYPCSR